MGTAQQSKGLGKYCLVLTSLTAKFKGWNYRSKLINHLVLGSNNNKFKPARTKSDWLTRDEEIVDEYLADERIDFIFTLNGFYNLFRIMTEMNETERLNNIPRELSVLFISGNDDPVGDFGKGIKKAYDIFKGLKIKNVSIKLYEDDRHEILNELDREQVYEDILSWMEIIKAY